MTSQTNQYLSDLLTSVSIILLLIVFISANLFVYKFYSGTSKQLTLEGKFLISNNMLQKQAAPQALAAHVNSKK